MQENQMPVKITIGAENKKIVPSQSAGGDAKGPAEWQESLCGCFSDIGSCCISCCFPCFQYGENKSRVDGGGSFGPCCMYLLTSFIGVHTCLGCMTRGRIREKYGIPGSAPVDCLCHCCCPCCALAQEAREIKKRQG
mmetsp:Transcript_4155/g.3520  ORF Transcript_4155/g.3520 Transcript_4155/m.3520 type:complete len:137 (+) Transcript_4155:125-535(+)